MSVGQTVIAEADAREIIRRRKGRVLGIALFVLSMVAIIYGVALIRL